MDENVKEQKLGEWYTLQVLSNQEFKVRDALARQILLGDAVPVYEVCVPSEKVSEVKDGRKRTIDRKMYPGYVFVRAALYKEENGRREIDEKVWYFIRGVQGIIAFMGGQYPLPLSENELRSFPPPMGPEVEQQVVVQKQIWNIGERVVITSGAFEGFEGKVAAVDDDRQRVTIEVTIFDRKTPTELEFWQVERAE